MTLKDRFKGEASYDAGSVYPTSWGVSGLQVKNIDFTGSGRLVTDAPVGSQYLAVTDINLSSDTAMVVHLFTESVASPFWSEALAANSGAQRTWRGKFKLPTVDKKVVAQASASGNLSVLLGYHSEE